MELFKDYSKEDYTPTESWLQKQKREKRDRQIQHDQKLKEAIQQWSPDKDLHIRGDPYKTLFVARLSYEVTESDLENEYSRYGPIERIRIVKDSNSKSRGYGFLVFDREQDMKAAYRSTNGMKIRGRPILVDVERGRTVRGWRSRRLGGGLGGRHYTKANLLRSIRGPQQQQKPPSFRSGRSEYDRGGRRGGGGYQPRHREDDRRNDDRRRPPPSASYRERDDDRRRFNYNGGGPPRDYRDRRQGPPPPSRRRYDDDIKREASPPRSRRM